MTRRRNTKHVIIEGTVMCVTWDADWDEKGVVIETPESDEEYYVEPDETGRELGEHLFEYVRVYGTLRNCGSQRKVFKAHDFQVLRFSHEGDAAWDFSGDCDTYDPFEESSSREDDLFIRSIRNGSLGY